MELYVIRRPSAWASLKELEAAGAKWARIGNEEMPDRVRWTRSYVVHEPDGRISTFCVYQARDGDSIREHAGRVGMPGEEFYRVATPVVVRDDPGDTATQQSGAPAPVDGLRIAGSPLEQCREYPLIRAVDLEVSIIGRFST